MTGIQPQLLNIALNPSDVVYTPDWVASDMVEYFQPHGRILEPCAGDGVFLKYLPAGTEWCEIERGRDFFQWREPVDWIVGNPPYSYFANWVYRAMELAKNVVYLAPCQKPFYSTKMFKALVAWGGIAHMRGYGTGESLGFPTGFIIGAVHFQRGYHGGMTMSYYEGAMP